MIIVGVGEVLAWRELAEGWMLWLHMGWEGDEGLIDPREFTDGTLPGSGVTEYTIGRSFGKTIDGTELQSFILRRRRPPTRFRACAREGQTGLRAMVRAAETNRTPTRRSTYSGLGRRVPP